MQQGMGLTEHELQLADAMLWQDLWRGGVREEIGDNLYPWFSVNQPLKPAPAAMSVEEPAALPPAPQRPVPPPLTPPQPAQAPTVRTESLVWHAGEGGGVAVVLRAHPARAGDIPLQGAALKLLETLLQRVGLAGTPVGYAVLGEAGEMIRPTQREALQAAVRALAPTRLLVMGQSAVGTLVGQGIGVEGWQAAPRPLVDGFCGPVGVTYPPELLLQRPLFKRLTWQHLQRWMET